MAKRFFVGVAFLALACAFVPVNLIAQSNDPVVGTWELNVSKSKTTGALPKGETRTFQIAGEQIKGVIKGTGADEKPTLVRHSARYDEKDHPYHPFTGSPLYDSIAVTRVDSHAVSFVPRRKGQVALTGTRTTSKDGNTMMGSGKGTSPEGKPTEILLVFEQR